MGVQNGWAFGGWSAFNFLSFQSSFILCLFSHRSVRCLRTSVTSWWSTWSSCSAFPSGSLRSTPNMTEWFRKYRGKTTRKCRRGSKGKYRKNRGLSSSASPSDSLRSTPSMTGWFRKYRGKTMKKCRRGSKSKYRKNRAISSEWTGKRNVGRVQSNQVNNLQ